MPGCCPPITHLFHRRRGFNPDAATPRNKTHWRDEQRKQDAAFQQTLDDRQLEEQSRGFERPPNIPAG